jgi:geranylgeranyl diphosphate synthase, type I
MDEVGSLDAVELRARIDAELEAVLARARSDVASRAPASAELVDEIDRLVRAGGRRVRPILCVLGHAAAGGRIEDVVPAAAGLELLHTFMLVHDDVMDDEWERRGVPATHRRFAEAGPEAEAFGRSAAILVGDLAFALGVDLVLSTPVAPGRVLAAARLLMPMALATAAGQFLDVRGDGGRDVDLAALKTGAYTAETPLAMGAVLAGAGPEVLAVLGAFARPVGVAFQLLDDVADGAAGTGAATRASRLLDEGERALVGAPITPVAAAGLREVVGWLREAV